MTRKITCQIDDLSPGTEPAEGSLFFHPTYYRNFSCLSVDVEDEETTREVSKNPDLSTLYTLQVVSKAIDISLAKVRVTVMVNTDRCVRTLFQFS